MSDFADDIDSIEDNSTPQSSRGMGRVRMAFARWWMILVFSILGYVVALYSLSIAQPSHEARAVLEVVTKERQLVGKDLELDKLTIDKTLTTIASKLVGPANLSKVAIHPKVQAIDRAIAPDFSFKPKYWRAEKEVKFVPAREATAAELSSMIAKNVKVSPRTGTTLIDVKVAHADSKAALAIADAIVESYLESEENRKSGGASEAFKVLRAEANSVAKELETSQRSIEIYKAALVLSEQLKSKRDSLILLRQRYLQKHPKRIQAEVVFNDIKTRFRREINLVSQVASEVDYWAQHKDKMNELAVVIEKEEGDVAVQAEGSWMSIVQNALSTRVGLLEGRISNSQNLFDMMTKRITEIDVAEENSEGEIKIAEQAFPSGDVTTDKYIRLAQGLVGGALLGFGIAYLLGMIDYKIYDVRTVEEATGLPCLAAIPDGVVFDLDGEWENVLTAEPNTANAEAIRNLRASIMLLGKSERHKSILITSAAPGEGKTTVASELAAAFALNEQKTILIDLDLRKPRVHTLFPKLNKDIGMSDVLAGQADLAKVVQKTNVDGLHVICTGSKAPNPSELLQENELSDIITKLCEYYDRVIVDTPPILPVSDTRLLAKHVQTVILVVRALKVPVGAIMRAKELLEGARAPIAGVAINAIKRKHGGSNYYGYKGYGEYGGSGGYGGYYDDEE